MDAQETVRLPEGWEEFEKMKGILAEKGEARVYFVAAVCSGRPGVREAKKMRAWISKEGGAMTFLPELVSLEETHFDGRGSKTYLTPAVKCRIRTAEEFAKAWWGLQAIHNSTCGCSIMVNDAQGTDVRVMDTEHISSGEGHAY